MNCITYLVVLNKFFTLNEAALFHESTPLSNSTIQRRIDEMGEDVLDQLIKILQSVSFSVALHESTTIDNEALVLS